MKASLKIRAIDLRKRGLTYSEILNQVPVAKSTLSLWLRSVGLSKSQKQKLTKKKLIAARRGAETRRRKRIETTKRIKQEAMSDVSKIRNEQLWLIGNMLYWAEGAKSKEHNPSQRVSFSNSDPRMIKIFLKWLQETLKLPNERISFGLYLHESHKEKAGEIQHYWADVCGFPTGKFDKIYYKTNKLGTRRRNTGSVYKGLLKINVTKSTNINRKIEGWIEGVCQQCGVV